MPTPHADQGEVRVEVRASGVNPSDVGLRMGRGGRPMQFPRFIPHSNGAGVRPRSIQPARARGPRDRRLFADCGQRNAAHRAIAPRKPDRVGCIEVCVALDGDARWETALHLGYTHTDAAGYDLLADMKAERWSAI
jgi:hypothetical protein